jgi:glucan biosynthesis protein C
MVTTNRRYDIDWLRVIAIGLLLLYHVAIGFQPWGIMIGFITNSESWTSLWFPMAMLNIWRIPFLFFVSGMGVYFAMQQRSWKQLMQDRMLRILLPFVFGMFCIFPLSVMIWQRYYNWKVNYAFNPGHLWFLGNMMVYVLLLAPLFYYLKKHEHGKFVQGLKTIVSHPLGLLPMLGLFIGEALVMNPNPYELYAMTWHGFVLGLLAFFCGFCFVLTGDGFWKMILKYRWMFLVLGVTLFTLRFILMGMKAPGYLLATESQCWILSMFAFGYKYLNRPGKVLSYLSEAAYPVYILHMIFLFLGSWWILPLSLPIQLEFALVLSFTITGCFAAFEIIKRINILRPLFGLKMRMRTEFIPTIKHRECPSADTVLP